MLPSLVMVSNPTVNFMLYETLRSRLEDWRRVFAGAAAFPLTSVEPRSRSYSHWNVMAGVLCVVP